VFGGFRGLPAVAAYQQVLPSQAVRALLLHDSLSTLQQGTPGHAVNPACTLLLPQGVGS
jgi:hypothetical protein